MAKCILQDFVKLDNYCHMDYWSIVWIKIIAKCDIGSKFLLKTDTYKNIANYKDLKHLLKTDTNKKIVKYLLVI